MKWVDSIVWDLASQADSRILSWENWNFIQERAQLT
jgi:hypothetical protein